MTLECTEIEWYKVETNSIDVMTVMKCGIYDLVILGFEQSQIPNFSFQIAKNKFDLF